MRNKDKQVTIESKAVDIVLAYNFAFGPELEYPRNEAIYRIIMNCLYTIQKDDGCSVEDIFKELKEKSPISFRYHVIEKGIQHLLKNGVIVSQKHNGQPRFLLKDRYNQNIEKQIKCRKDLLNRCIEKIISGVTKRYVLITKHQREIVSNLFTDFIVFVFSKFGFQCAKMIIGGILSKDLMNLSQIKDKLSREIAGYHLTEPELVSAIRTEFYKFFREPDPDYGGLKFYMAQNFYILKLLGLDPQARALSKVAFRSSHMYLDSNVIITALLSESRPYHSFKEFYKIARDIGIDICVSKITQDEIRNVIAYQRSIADTYDNIPESMEDQVTDAFYKTYKKSKERDENFTIDKLFAPFENLESTLRDDFKIFIEDEKLYDTILKQKNELEKIKNVLQKKSKDIRNKEKRKGTLNHDAFHFLLIINKREETPKTWFLTLDTSLPPASTEILEDNVSHLCFTLDSWLQCISPFIPEDSIEDFSFVFSNVFGSEIFEFEQAYGVEDFKIWTDMEMDTKKMPDPMVKEYSQYIKNEIRKGRPYNEELKKEIIYKLRKKFRELKERYFQVDIEKDKQIKELQTNMNELQQHLDNEIQRRKDTEQELKETVEKIPDIEQEVEKILKKRQREVIQKRKVIFRRLAASVGWASAILIWIVPYFVAGTSILSSFWHFFMPIIVAILSFLVFFWRKRTIDIIGYIVIGGGFIKLIWEIWNLFGHNK